MRLLEIKVEITNKCFLKCIHCSSGSDTYGSSSLPLSVLKKMVKESKALGCQSFLLSGGEPLLYPDLASLLSFLSRSGVHTKIYTTGIINDNPLSSISIGKLNQLKRVADFQFAFSLYSSDPVDHDAITSLKGSFEATVRAIRNATALNIITEIQFVPLKNTVIGFPSLVDFAYNLGITQISVLRFVPQGRGKDNKERICPAPEDLRRLRSMIISQRKRKNGIKIRLGSPLNILLIGNPRPCTSGRNRMIVDAEGLAYPCDALKHVHLGEEKQNVFRNSLSEILEHGLSFKAVRSKSIPRACKNCPSVSQCQGGCLAQRLLSDRMLESCVDPGCLHSVIRNVSGRHSLNDIGKELRCQIG